MGNSACVTQQLHFGYERSYSQPHPVLVPSIFLLLTNAQYQLSGLVVRVSALRLRGWISIPGQVIPKTLKNGTQCLPA